MIFPLGYDHNRGGYLLSVVWCQFALSFAFVALRFYCRTRITRNVWWDDWCCLFAFICIVVFTSILSVYALGGGAAHSFDLQPTQVSHLTELNFISQACQVMSLAVGKISVALLMYRLQPPTRWRTWLLVFLSISSLLLAILVIIIFFVQCQPTSGLWRPGTATCWDQAKTNDWLLAVGSYWALVDLLLALLPITFLYKLQISWKRKFILAILLGLGVFAAACAAIKTAHIRKKTTDPDITWDTTSLIVWNTTEANVIIYAACLPTISELLRRVFETIASYVTTHLHFRRLPSLAEIHTQRANGTQHVRLRDFQDTGRQQHYVKAHNGSDDAMVPEPIKAALV